MKICKRIDLSRIHLSVLLCCSSLIAFGCGQEFPDVGSSCNVRGASSLRGECTPIQRCPAAIADLKAGVNPTICTFKDKKGIVCCPKESRISIKKCKEYTNILASPDGPVPYLPVEFLPSDKNIDEEVQCGAILNGLIVGGRDAKTDEFPHMAALAFESGDKTVWGCGGTLISDEWVLTAAHCVDANKLGRPTKILLGDISLNEKVSSNKRILVGISEYIKHPGYKQPLSYNDIALLRIDRRLTLSRSILPACLPDPASRIDRKDQVTATGWGRLGFADAQSEILQAVNLTKVNTSSCNQYYNDLPGKALKYPQGITKKQICAGDKDASKDTCSGDSGGPLTANLDKRCVHYVTGITSFGSNYCGTNTPGIYTNVHSYLDWIEETVWPGA